MLLGDVIRGLDNEVVAAETLLGVGDLGLLAAMRTAAAASGLSPGAFAARAVRFYADAADEAEWVALMGDLGRASDPGVACLERAFAWTLANTGPDA